METLLTTLGFSFFFLYFLVSCDLSLSFSPFSLCAGTLLPGLPQIYHTARVFKAPSKYVFDVKDPGTHMLRLHFHRFTLTNFSGGRSFNSEKVEITFLPAEKSKFAFVSAIVVISAPKDLILETAQSVNGDKVKNFEGGPKVTPFNDSLWRTWLPDDDYFRSKEGSNRVYFSGRIKYQDGGASREVGPDNVYNSARLIESKNASIPNVIEGYQYLVRLHFCDIASISLGLLFFNVYDGHLAYKDLDPSAVTNYLLASPFYVALVVDAEHSGIVNVTVGPSNKSMVYAVDAILNGVEIMKMSNWMGSFDGKEEFLLPLIALVCLLLSLSAIIGRRKEKVESVLRSKLPMEVHEISPKQGKQQLSSINTWLWVHWVL
ncbi:hypothetical protein ERO13_D11G095700v2 [Gossypium hirsutum]|nr:hypothetical protein ERO13_D11G095700v2 [Gossypium hirsutum]